MDRDQVIALNRGHPQDSMLPAALMQEAMSQLQGQELVDFLQYSNEFGNIDFTTSLAAFLSAQYGTRVVADQLLGSAGVSSAIDIVCSVLLQPGDVVLTEDPTYFLALPLFTDRGAVIKSFDSSSPNGLLEAIKHYSPKLVYIIPSCQNPTGQSLDEDTRQSMARVCQEQQVYMIADEVYQMLHFSSPPLPMAGRGDMIISVGSFTKILCPGSRCGWIQAAPGLIKRFSSNPVLISGGSISHLSSGIILQLLKSPEKLVSYITSLQRLYASREQALADAITKYILQAEFTRPRGGYFIWVRVPGVNFTTLRELSIAEFAVNYLPGSMCSSPPSSTAHSDKVRLCFAFYPEDILVEGVRRLSSTIRQ